MGKSLILGLTLLVALAPLSVAAAASQQAEIVEGIVVDLERLFGRIEGVDYEALTVRDLGNGLRGVAIPLPEATLERLRAASASDASAADFKTMATGLQLTEPSSVSVLITAADALENTDYIFWFVVGNLRSTAEERKTTFQMKGPGDKFKHTAQIEYPARSLFALVVEESSGDAGFHTIQAKVAKGGKAKTIYFAQ